MSQKQVVTRPGGTPKITRDATLNDNDKSITVPAGKAWLVGGLFYTYSASADVGNRQVRIGIFDASNNNLWTSYVSPALTASQFMRVRAMPGVGQAAPNDPDASQSRDVGLPNPCLLPAGYYLRVWDQANVTANDDIDVSVFYTEYEA